MISVCVDAMGGDEKPEVVLQGIERALAQDQDLCVVVAGEREAIADFCATHERTRALFTTEVIEMDEHPAQAVRDKKDSSIVRGCMAVKRVKPTASSRQAQRVPFLQHPPLRSAAFVALSGLVLLAFCLAAMGIKPSCWIWAPMLMCAPT